MGASAEPRQSDEPAWQGTLFGAQAPALTPLRPERTWLDRSCWIDRQPTWLVGADQLFAEVAQALPWQGGRRPMYDRMVDVPRLTAFLPVDDPRFPDVVAQAALALQLHYAEPFRLVGANLYRHGGDSVAWHADRIGRVEKDPIIAIVSIGGRRSFRLRPMGGGTGLSVPMYGGDLLVMGGACQHRWEHAVPKSRTGEPRISLTFRHRDGRGADDPLRLVAPP